ncbi:MAG: hypothetical protein ACRBB6_03215 [Neptuniibacter sp.]
MWSVEGRQIIHNSGLSIEVMDGTFANPMNLSVRGDNGLSAPELALLIREGLNFATRQFESGKYQAPQVSALPEKKKRPILKLKK